MPDTRLSVVHGEVVLNIAAVCLSIGMGLHVSFVLERIMHVLSVAVVVLYRRTDFGKGLRGERVDMRMIEMVVVVTDMVGRGGQRGGIRVWIMFQRRQSRATDLGFGYCSVR